MLMMWVRMQAKEEEPNGRKLKQDEINNFAKRYKRKLTGRSMGSKGYNSGRNGPVVILRSNSYSKVTMER
jgi:hypothetical protein